jgi:Asp/Glu/hydantoin racemase
MKILLIVPIYFEKKETEQRIFKRLKDHLETVKCGATQIDYVSLPKGATPSIESRSDRENNKHFVLRIAIDAERDGYDGVFVSDMDMCGVDEARRVLRIPVVGGFRPCVNAAMLLAKKFSIITMVEGVVEMQKGHVLNFGFFERFASIRVVNIPVCELIDDSLRSIPFLVTAAVRAVQEDGADSIIFGCTGFVDVAKQVQDELCSMGIRVPVIDPNRTAINCLENLIKNSLTQSGMVREQHLLRL